MKTNDEYMGLCVDTHMECIQRWSGWGIPSSTFQISIMMCAMAFDYIARGDY